VTDRARVALLPDETPVENVGLRLQTGIALRRNGTTTLGELRELPDRELLRLRGVGRNRLAEVRSLVPAPEGGRR
jgi:DNA-directed RNA polymerase alpha subunit